MIVVMVVVVNENGNNAGAGEAVAVDHVPGFDAKEMVPMGEKGKGR